MFSVFSINKSSKVFEPDKQIVFLAKEFNHISQIKKGNRSSSSYDTQLKMTGPLFIIIIGCRGNTGFLPGKHRFLAGETPVSCRGNTGFLPGKHRFPAEETGVSRAGNWSFQSGELRGNCNRLLNKRLTLFGNFLMFQLRTEESQIQNTYAQNDDSTQLRSHSIRQEAHKERENRSTEQPHDHQPGYFILALRHRLNSL